MRELVLTKDGSHTIALPEKGITYHSVHGAIQESVHVFIEAGLNYLINQTTNQPIHLFEMGLGTGLNAFLTAIQALEKKQPVYYTTLETAPILLEEALLLNYPEALGHQQLFQRLHQSEWNKVIEINDYFTLEKNNTDLFAFHPTQPFHLIYYDAFAPSAQPELWTQELFEKLHRFLFNDGVLVTYCSKGDVKRALIAAGFTVKKLPGPAGKREMIRATKKSID